ncbi:hypothetical protein D3C73_1504570 [compost metagenome]
MRGLQLFSELMGADRFIYLDIGNQMNLIVRVNPRNYYDDDTKVEVAIDMNKALFFDKNTGSRLIE